jgi:hypothetical protein
LSVAIQMTWKRRGRPDQAFVPNTGVTPKR